MSQLSPRIARAIGEPIFAGMGMRQGPTALALSRARRVLVVRLDDIGDVVLTSPLLRELRRTLPAARVTMVVDPRTYDLVELCPYVDEVLRCDLRPLGSLQRHWRTLQLAYRSLWRHGFDLAIVPRWDVDQYHAAFVAYLSGARWRAGYSEGVIDHRRRLDAGFDRLFTHVLQDKSVKHEVEHNLDVLRFLGGEVHEERLETWTSHADEVFADSLLQFHGVGAGNLLVAFGPGATQPKRRWPLSCFAEVGAWLQSELRARMVIVGGQGEEPLGRELCRQLGDAAIDVVGRTSLRQTAALLRRCQLYVGNDSGPMHLAAASGAPVVEISSHPTGGSPAHPNSPLRFAPWDVAHVVLQPRPQADSCSDACVAEEAHCIRHVSVERVKQAVAAQVAQRRRGLEQRTSGSVS